MSVIFAALILSVPFYLIAAELNEIKRQSIRQNDLEEIWQRRERQKIDI